MKAVIDKALLNSHSYAEYRKIVSDLLAEGKVSGDKQSEDLVHYTLLNETRMNRLEKTLKITDEVSEKLKNLQSKYIWLVISEGWCGDAAQLLPVFNKLEIVTPNIEMKIVFRDGNPALVNMFLTNGTKSIPKLIILDKATKDVLSHWGPRPKSAAQLVKSYKNQYGKMDETIKTELQLWYLHDKGLSTQQEIVDIMIDLEQRIK